MTVTLPRTNTARTTYTLPSFNMTILALSYLTNQYGPPSTITTVSCKDRQLTDTEDLTPCQQLTRLDLSSNQFHSLLRLSSAASLTHLTLANNRLTSLKHVQHLRQLQLLNIAHNAVESLDHLTPLTHLVALIANNNAIATLPLPANPAANPTTPRLPPQLHTLVLSHNHLTTLPAASLAHLTQLTKLSLSHNQLTALPGAAVTHLVALTELRLNNNQLTSLPPQLSACQRLKLIDVGSNGIEGWEGVVVVERLPYLRNLQLKGNGVERTMGVVYREEVLKRLPLLAVLDSHKVKGVKAAKDGQSEERKEGDGEEARAGGRKEVAAVSEMKEEPRSKAAVAGKSSKADSRPQQPVTASAGGMRMDSGRKRRMEQMADGAAKGKSLKAAKAAKQSPQKVDKSDTPANKPNKRTKATPTPSPMPAPTAGATPQPSTTATDEADDQAMELDALTAEAKKRQREKEKQRKAEERLIRERGKAAGVLDVTVHKKAGEVGGGSGGGSSTAFSVEQLTRGEEERDVVGGGAGWE